MWLSTTVYWTNHHHVNLARLLLSLHLTVTAVVSLLFFPPSTWGQVHPSVDPGISSYVFQESVSGKLSISVSETIQPLVRTWVDGLGLQQPKLKVTVMSDGTENGLGTLLEHRTEMAAMSRRLTAAEITDFILEYGSEPMEIPVALDALAIFVHKDNPIAGLSLDDLDAMFCRERQRGVRYPVDSWGLVGVMDEWFEAPVRLYGRNGKSGTSYFFRKEVCKDGTFLPQLVDAPGSASAVLDVGDDPEGIGFGTIRYRTTMVKPVPIAAVKGGRYVEPSLQTIMDSSYPLRRYVYFYVAKPPKGSPSPASAELAHYALSRQGQQMAIDLGYFPLSLTEITRLTSKRSAASKPAQPETPNRPVAE
ncbi:MAG: PstS family phosphate ABC transporter substrate-binding protein [Nitrospira sp.]